MTGCHVDPQNSPRFLEGGGWSSSPAHQQEALQSAPLDLSPEGTEEMAQPSPHFAGVETGGKAAT